MTCQETDLNGEEIPLCSLPSVFVVLAICIMLLLNCIFLKFSNIFGKQNLEHKHAITCNNYTAIKSL